MKNILYAFLLFALPAFATISQRQSPVSQFNSSSSSTCSATLSGSGYHSGDLIVVWTYWTSSTTLTATVSDLPYKNNYVSAVGPTQSSASTPTTAQIFYAANTKVGTGGDVITVQFSGSASTSGCVFVEYLGADQNYPLDSVSTGYSTSGNQTGLLDSGNAAPANSNLLVFGGGITDTGTLLAGTNFTSIQASGGAITEQNANPISGNNVLQRATACIASGPACSTTASGNWLMQMAIFRDASWTVTGGWNPARPAQVQFADQFPGTDPCAQARTAIETNVNGNSAPTADARGFESGTPLTCANAPMGTTDTGITLLPSATISAQTGWQLYQYYALIGNVPGSCPNNASTNSGTCVSTINGFNTSGTTPLAQIQFGNGTLQLYTRVENITFEGNGLPGTEGLQNDYQQELSWCKNCRFGRLHSGGN
jgi:hypothetical protein